MRHPASPLLAWLAATLTVQFIGWGGLGLLGGALAVAGGAVRRRWWHLLRRARWLLLTLWLILAFGTPGEALVDAAWAPTDAGVAAANLHALRLALMLGLLAWLFARLGQTQLVAGLWSVARPLKALGVAVDRLVVRLALVFDYLEQTPPKGSWRHLLHEHALVHEGPAVIRLALAPWSRGDSALLLATAALVAAMVWLP